MRSILFLALFFGTFNLYAQHLLCSDAHIQSEVTAEAWLSQGESTLLTECSVRILVIYTNAAASQVSDPYTHAQNYIDYFNVANQESGVSWDAELAGALIYSYTQTGLWNSAGLSIDLERFRNSGDGWLDQVHIDRSLYDADLCVLVTEDPIMSFGSAFGGSAYTIGASSSDAFTQIWWQNSVATLAHECGHLMGLRHGTDGTTTPYSYGHGYGHSTGFLTFQTIMGGSAACGACPQVQRWSSDDLLYVGLPSGNTTFADASRALRNAFFGVSTFQITPFFKYITDAQSIINGEYAHLYSENFLSKNDGITFLVFPGGTAEFEAQSSIRIGPGFHAYSGSNFHAKIIGGCSAVIPDMDEESSSKSDLETSPSALTIHPNPSDKQSRISVSSKYSTTLNLQLFNNHGAVIRQIYHGQIAEGSHKWELSTAEFNAGIYYLIGTLGAHRISSKLVVVH